GLALADQLPTGIVHINDQTVNDEANVPFGGVAASGTGSRFGGAAANIDAFTETRWITMRSQTPSYPFCLLDDDAGVEAERQVREGLDPVGVRHDERHGERAAVVVVPARDRPERERPDITVLAHREVA